MEIKPLKENVTQFNLGLMFFCVETVHVDLLKVLSGYRLTKSLSKCQETSKRKGKSRGIYLYCSRAQDKIPTGRYCVVLINHHSSTESLVLPPMESLDKMIG